MISETNYFFDFVDLVDFIEFDSLIKREGNGVYVPIPISL
jgi:hypothetical protein